MSGIREQLSAEELSMHDTWELLPQSADILREDIENGRIIMKPEKGVSKTVENTAENTAGVLDENPE